MKPIVRLQFRIVALLSLLVTVSIGCQEKVDPLGPVETVPPVLVLFPQERSLEFCNPHAAAGVDISEPVVTGHSVVVKDLIVDSALSAEPDPQPEVRPPEDPVSIVYIEAEEIEPTDELISLSREDDRPVSVDVAMLTYWSETTGLGGAHVYDLYTRMWHDKTGWWWQAFGENGYSVWDFISTFSYYEASGYTRWADVMAEAGVRWYYATGAVYGEPGSIEGVLNWWAAFSESTADAYFAGPNYYFTLTWGTSLDDVKKLTTIGESFANPPPAWSQGYDPERPFGWGNLYVCYSDREFIDARQELLLSNMNALFVYFGEGNTAFIVPSGCAWAMGYHLRYDAKCDTVTDYTYAR